MRFRFATLLLLLPLLGCENTAANMAVNVLAEPVTRLAIAAAKVTKSGDKETNVRFPVAFKWEGVAESASGTLTTPTKGDADGTFFATLGADVGNCSGRWENKGGGGNGVKGFFGIWQLRCNRGLTATGTYRMTGDRVGEGEGKDSRGRLIEFKIGETAIYEAAKKPAEGAKTARTPAPSSSVLFIRKNHCHLATSPYLKWEEKEVYRENISAAKQLGLGQNCRVQLGLYYVRPSEFDQASNDESVKKEAQVSPQEASLGAPKQQIEEPDKPPIPRPVVIASPTVREAQRLLNALGYNVGSADGISGPRTRAAVRDYQLRQGLPNTGEVTEDLVAHLENNVRAERAVAIARARERLEREEATRQPKQSIPSLEYAGSGTGFIVNSSGYALTNAHVIENCTLLKATLPDRTSVAATVIALDQQNDLGAIKLARAPSRSAKFRSGTLMRPGDEAVAFGYPLSGLLASGGNVTLGYISALAGIRDDARYYQITVPVQPGNSGGPLLDTNGNVIGVISSKLDALIVAELTGDIPQNINFAIKATLAQTFLNSNGITYETDSGEVNLTPADIGERAKGFSVRIDCFE